MNRFPSNTKVSFVKSHNFDDKGYAVLMAHSDNLCEEIDGDLDLSWNTRSGITRNVYLISSTKFKGKPELLKEFLASLKKNQGVVCVLVEKNLYKDKIAQNVLKQFESENKEIILETEEWANSKSDTKMASATVDRLNKLFEKKERQNVQPFTEVVVDRIATD